MIHRTVLVGDQGTWQCRCTCPSRSPLGTKTEAYTWEEKHHREVNRARRSLSKTPSLRDQRDFYQRMADDVTLPRPERDHWQTLADELTHRVFDEVPDLNQPTLF
jgi:hypothetical protein